MPGCNGRGLPGRFRKGVVGSGKRQHPTLAGKDPWQDLYSALTLLSRSGKVRACPSASPFLGSPSARDLVLQFHPASIALSHVVIESHSEIGNKAQNLTAGAIEPLARIGSLGLFLAALLSRHQLGERVAAKPATTIRS